jgi:putative transposase
MVVEISRRDVSPAELRRAAGRTSDAARRMPAIALALERCARGDAARQCSMDRQILRDWVHRFNAEGIAGLSDRPLKGGAPGHLSAEQQEQVAEWVRIGPELEMDGVVRRRRIDLQRKIAAAFKVQMHERSVGKVLHRLGFRHISVRPRHPQAEAAVQEAHKETLPPWSPQPSRHMPTASRSNSGGRTKRRSASRAA